MIKLQDTKNDLLDSVSNSYEDSFTLETFQDMIEASHGLDKSFILARVSTVDPKNPEKSFYSYYNAYQLNKVLFQTQVIKGKKYIHRLHVLNPLSNLDIVGDVLYFQVKPIKDIAKDVAEEIIPSESAVNVDAKSPAKWTLAGPVISPLSEEIPNDFKGSKDKAHTYPPVIPMQTVQIQDNITIDMSEINCPVVLVPGQISLVGIKDRKISIIPRGAVSQYNTPISDKLPSIKKGNRRAYSWMNTNNSFKQQLSFDEWKIVAQNHQKSNQDEDDYDLVDNSTNEYVQDDQIYKVEYTAVLFATDNDYLESAKIRGYFKSNAITPDDTKLFEMPTVEEVSPARYTIDDIRAEGAASTTKPQSKQI